MLIIFTLITFACTCITKHPWNTFVRAIFVDLVTLFSSTILLAADLSFSCLKKFGSPVLYPDFLRPESHRSAATILFAWCFWSSVLAYWLRLLLFLFFVFVLDVIVNFQYLSDFRIDFAQIFRTFVIFLNFLKEFVSI